MTVPGVELAVLDLDFGLQSSELGYFVLVAETAAIEKADFHIPDIGQLAMLKGSSVDGKSINLVALEHHKSSDNNICAACSAKQMLDVLWAEPV